MKASPSSLSGLRKRLPESVQKQLLAPPIKSTPRFSIPTAAAVWRAEQFSKYLNHNKIYTRYSVDKLYSEKNIKILRSIKHILKIPKVLENAIHNLEEKDMMKNQLALRKTSLVNTVDLDSILNNTSFAEASKLWDQLIEGITTLENEQDIMMPIHYPKKLLRQYKYGEISDISNLVYDILLSLIPTHHPETLNDQSWSYFDRFWTPVVSSYITPRLVPELVIRASLLFSPQIGAQLLLHIDSSKFSNLLELPEEIPPEATQKIQLKSQATLLKNTYERSLICGLNAYILLKLDFVLKLAKYPQSKILIDDIWDSIYQTISEFRSKDITIKLFPSVFTKLAENLPQSQLSRFYLLFLYKGVRLDGLIASRIPKSILSNGNEQDKKIVLNTDKIMYLKKREEQRKKGQKETTSVTPTFHITAYSSLLKYAARIHDEKTANFIERNVLMGFAKNSFNLYETLITALQTTAERKDIKGMDEIYDFIISQEEFKEDVNLYAILFRGFRKMADKLGSDKKCFELLNYMDMRKWELPTYLCIEILTLINERYHFSVMLKYYVTYFGTDHLDELGIFKYFQEASVPQSIVEPPYDITTSSIANNPNFQQHEFNPIALALLYDSMLKSVTTIQEVVQLYRTFVQSKLYHTTPKFYFPVVDSFVRCLCGRLATEASVSFAEKIVIDMVSENESFQNYKKSVVIKDQSVKSTSSHALNQRLDSKLPSYLGNQLQCFGILIKAYCGFPPNYKSTNIQRALSILKLAYETSPVLYNDMFRPIILYYLFKDRNLKVARQWYDAAIETGVIIPSRKILQQLNIETSTASSQSQSTEQNEAADDNELSYEEIPQQHVVNNTTDKLTF